MKERLVRIRGISGLAALAPKGEIGIFVGSAHGGHLITVGLKSDRFLRVGSPRDPLFFVTAKRGRSTAETPGERSQRLND